MPESPLPSNWLSAMDNCWLSFIGKSFVRLEVSTVLLLNEPEFDDRVDDLDLYNADFLSPYIGLFA